MAKQQSFQFHKGTIRTEARPFNLKNIYYFNSIKVRLELHGLEYDNQAKKNFNSIKVRLELQTEKENMWLHSFQFHKGTIRTPNYFGPDW